MAKGKHAAALFEVINRGKKPDQQVGMTGALRTPRWWFKRNAQGHSAPPPAATGQSETPSLSPTPTLGDAMRRPGISLDTDKQTISLKLTYTTAAITAFALIVVLGLTYLVGRSLRSGPAVANASPSIEETLHQPPQPQVMDVPQTTDTPATDNPTSAVTQTPAPTPPPSVVVQDGKRQNGLNYVVIQSYPDEKTALEVRNLLIQNNVGATIEKGLRGLNPNWYIVVGTDGFARVSSPEYQSYIRRLQAISSKFAQKGSFKSFDPMGYRWDRGS
ncbi:MAG: hypothetical protein IT447_02685 [Phycisphaerales bacterium]|jgi:hypothetical protein|nr:hypothetical protein [Phycisphaerales bacterium]